MELNTLTFTHKRSQPQTGQTLCSTHRITATLHLTAVSAPAASSKLPHHFKGSENQRTHRHTHTLPVGLHASMISAPVQLSYRKCRKVGPPLKLSNKELNSPYLQRTVMGREVMCDNEVKQCTRPRMPNYSLCITRLV